MVRSFVVDCCILVNQLKTRRMKKITRLEDVMSIMLSDLYEAEKTLQAAIPHCLENVSSTEFKEVMQKYQQSCQDKILKIDLVFGYLMTEPLGKKNIVINSLLSKTQQLTGMAGSARMRDVLLRSCIHTINHYKTAGYATAITLAEELSLNTPHLLLSEILFWEKEIDQELSKLISREVNLKA